jgi:hypothetical protein
MDVGPVMCNMRKHEMAILDKKFIHCDGDSEQSVRVRLKRWRKEIAPSILLIPDSDP